MPKALRGALLLVVLTLGSVVVTSPVRAAETSRDTATDHLDAFDDGGPPSVGLLVNPLALIVGSFGFEGDFALGDAAALSAEVRWVSTPGVPGYGAAVGLPIFPWRALFHGLYLHPRALGQVAFGGGGAVATLGIGASAGWQQTWRFGLSLRVGGGVAYEGTLQSEGGGITALGLRLLLDGELGWVF